MTMVEHGVRRAVRARASARPGSRWACGTASSSCCWRGAARLLRRRRDRRQPDPAGLRGDQHDAAIEGVDPRPDRPRAAPPGPLPDQRAPAGYHRFWHGEGLRRVEPRACPGSTRGTATGSRDGEVVTILVVGRSSSAGSSTRSPCTVRVPRRLIGVTPHLLPGRDLPLVLDRLPVRPHDLFRDPRRRGDLLPRRHRDPLLRRVGSGPGAARRFARTCSSSTTRGHRAEGRIRPERHPAVGTARHREDAHGRGHGRRDGQAVRQRRRRDAQHMGMGVSR